MNPLTLSKVIASTARNSRTYRQTDDIRTGGRTDGQTGRQTEFFVVVFLSSKHTKHEHSSNGKNFFWSCDHYTLSFYKFRMWWESKKNTTHGNFNIPGRKPVLPQDRTTCGRLNGVKFVEVRLVADLLGRLERKISMKSKLKPRRTVYYRIYTSITIYWIIYTVVVFAVFGVV